MSREEVKGGQQPTLVRPRVHTTKACIVSMEYKIKNKDEIEKVKPLNESYADAERVVRLFRETLGWHDDDVKTFRDSNVGIKNIYYKINKHIQDLKTAASLTTREDAQHLNIFAFIGHGVINEKNEALFLVNSKSDDGKIEIKAINVDQVAKKFAEDKNTMTIIFFIACRLKSIEYNNEQAQNLPAVSNNGISIVFYASECGFATQMKKDVGNEQLKELLTEIENVVNEKKYSWRILEDKVPPNRRQIITSMAGEDIPYLLVFKPKFMPDPEYLESTAQTLEQRLCQLYFPLQQKNLGYYLKLLGDDEELQNSDSFQAAFKPFEDSIQQQKWKQLSVEIFKTFLKGDIYQHYAMKIFLMYEESAVTSPMLMNQAYLAIKNLDVPDECKDIHKEFIENFPRLSVDQLYNKVGYIIEEYEDYGKNLSESMKLLQKTKPANQAPKIIHDTVED